MSRRKNRGSATALQLVALSVALMAIALIVHNYDHDTPPEAELVNTVAFTSTPAAAALRALLAEHGMVLKAQNGALVVLRDRGYGPHSHPPEVAE
jgi:hypothetical protein